MLVQGEVSKIKKYRKESKVMVFTLIHVIPSWFYVPQKNGIFIFTRFIYIFINILLLTEPLMSQKTLYFVFCAMSIPYFKEI